MLLIRKGDLTEEKESAIVNPANEQLNHAGGAAKAIASKGGKVIQERVKEIYQETWAPTNWRSNYNKCWRFTMRKSYSCCWTNLSERYNERSKIKEKQLRSAIKSILKEIKKV